MKKNHMSFSFIKNATNYRANFVPKGCIRKGKRGIWGISNLGKQEISVREMKKTFNMSSINKFLLPIVLLLGGLKMTGQEIRSAEELALKGYKRFAVESGIVQYKLEGTNTGTEALYFDNWGWRAGLHTISNIRTIDMSRSENIAKIIDGWIQYNLEKNTMNGTKLVNPELKAWWEKYKTYPEDRSAIGKQVLMASGGEPTGKGVVLGRPCEIWNIPAWGAKLWLWKGIPLKYTIAKLGMKYTATATSVQIDIEVPEKSLLLSPDAHITMDLIGKWESNGQ